MRPRQWRTLNSARLGRLLEGDAFPIFRRRPSAGPETCPGPCLGAFLHAGFFIATCAAKAIICIKSEFFK